MIEATKAATPALTPATPTMMASEIWLAARAASDTGTNRMNRVPDSLRSFRRTGAGSKCHAALAIFIGASGMYDLVNGRSQVGATRIQYGTRPPGSLGTAQPRRTGQPRMAQRR